MEEQMEKALRELNIRLDPVVKTHLINGSIECADTDEIRDLCECFLEDAGLSDIEAFMQYFQPEKGEISMDSLKLVEDENYIESTQQLATASESEHIANTGPNIDAGASVDSIDTLSSISVTALPENHNIIYDQTPKESESLSKMRAVTKHQAPGQRIKEIRRLKAEEKVEVATVDPSLIEATTKQSRFHVDTLETLSNVVDLNGINISIGGRPILVDAELRLFTGIKYGLIGRNGVGKSTLFKALGYGFLIGFPKNIRVLYVEQILTTSNTSVLNAVMEADKVSMRAVKEFSMLSKACERGVDADTAKVIREIELQRLEDELIENNNLAIKRSGARGNVARADLLISEVTVGEARARLTKPVSVNELQNATKNAMQMMEEIHHIIELFDADTAKSKAIKILLGLGFTEEMIQGSASTLSGGWKIRAALAQALFTEPDILLLDEPTNHLDLNGIIWLQEYIKSLENVTIVIVSHDRTFLNNLTTETIIMRSKKLEYFTGSYQEYQKNDENIRKNKEKVAGALDKKKKHIEKSIQQGLKQAKQKGDDKKLAMVASRKKKLNDRFGIEKSSKGHRFRLNDVENAGYFLTSRQQVDFGPVEGEIRWSFPQPAPLRHQGSLIQVENISFSYGSTLILRQVTLNVQLQDRIGIVGNNGGGKSTLIKLLVGQLQPNAGLITRHSQAKIGYFSQDYVNEIATVDEKLITSQYIKQKIEENEIPLDITKPSVSEKEIRRHFGNFGVGGEQMMLAVSQLSGGQAVRIAIGLATWQHPTLLILDEITNHLDMDTIEAVIVALKGFQGAVIAVSHDQHFLDQVANVIMVVKDQTLSTLPGGVKQYVQMLKGSCSV